MADLYGVLGVKPTATKKQIKDAYRGLARKHHPDLGGDPEMFNVLKRAYDTLHDDARRAHYDATGEAPEPKDKPNPDAQIYAVVGNLMAVCIGGMERPNLNDLVGAMRGKIKEGRQQMHDQLKDVRQSLARCREVEPRIKRKGEGKNVMASLLRGQIVSLENELKTAGDRFALFDKVEAFLLDYEYDTDKMIGASGIYGLHGLSHGFGGFGT